MKIFVVVVTYNGANWIRAALQSVRTSSLPCTAIVVDNASTDNTLNMVREEFTETVLIASPQNAGFGIGNNIGIRYALDQGADYIFLLNQDAFLTPTAIAQLTEFLETHPEFSLASPLHCSPDLHSLDPQTQRAYLQRYVPEFLSDACLGQIKPYYPIRGINAAAWMLRAEVFQKVGGFDPIFFMYGEDDDLINRLALHEQRSALLPASRIVHLRAKAPRQPLPFFQDLWSRSERHRSALLLDLKLPQGRLAGKMLRLLTGGVIQPLTAMLNDQDYRNALAAWLAAGRVLCELPRIRRHARLCATQGAHFLNAEARS